MARQGIIVGYMLEPVYIDETTTNEGISAVYLSETISAGGGGGGSGTANQITSYRRRTRRGKSK